MIDQLQWTLAQNQKSLTNIQSKVNRVGCKLKWILIKQVQKYSYEHFSIS